MAWEHGKVRYFEQSSDPIVNDDENNGYRVSDIWINLSADTSYRCLDASAGAAVWEQSTGTAHAQNTDTALGIQAEILDMGGHHIHNVEDATHLDDAATLNDLLNRLNIVLNFWLMPDSALSIDLVVDETYEPEEITETPQTLGIEFKSSVADTPTPFAIPAATIILTHFQARVASATGTKPVTLQTELWYTDADGESNPIQIGSSSEESAVLTEAQTGYYNHLHVVDALIVPAGKRLWLKFIAITTGTKTDPTVWIYNGDTHGHLSIGVAGSVLGRYLQLAGGTMLGNITMASTETVDGRDLSVDGAVLDVLDAELTDWLGNVTLESDGLTTVPEVILTPIENAIADKEGGLFYNSLEKAVYVCISE